MTAFQTILVPTDFSKHSDSSLRFAIRLARDCGARLRLLHVVEPPLYSGELGMTLPTPPESLAVLEEKLRKRAETEGAGVPFDTMVVEGSPAREILRVADEAACDLIVLSTHGRTGLRRVLLGSVAEEVIRHATRPVLTLKAPLAFGPEAPEPAAPREARETLVDATHAPHPARSESEKRGSHVVF
jgi:nucleotide-binding universal stress UspA family protein